MNNANTNYKRETRAQNTSAKYKREIQARNTSEKYKHEAQASEPASAIEFIHLHLALVSAASVNANAQLTN